MSKISSAGHADINTPDLEWVDRFGAVFDWTPAQYSSVRQQLRSASKNRNFPADPKEKSILFFLFTVIMCVGSMFSMVIIFTIMRQPYVDPYSNLMAGIVVGWSALSIVLIICGLFVRRLAKPVDADWFYTTVRIGIENNVLWLCKHGTMYIYPDIRSFYRILRIDDFLIVFVSKTAAHFLPCKILSQSEEGRKVLKWFDENWPKGIGFHAVSGDGSAISWAWRLRRRVVIFLSVFVPGMIAVYGVQYVLDAWREIKRHEAIASLPAYGEKSLTGSDAVRFLYGLTHPGGK